MIKIILIVSVVLIVGGLEPDDKCMSIAKPTICASFFPADMKNCLHHVISYNKITLNLCSTMKTNEGGDACIELRKVCSDYRFAAVYAPFWPKELEYEFNCNQEKLVNLGFGTFGFISFLLAAFAVAMCCREKRRSLEAFVDEPLNVNVNITSPIVRSESSSRKRHGASAEATEEVKGVEETGAAKNVEKEEEEEGRDYFTSGHKRAESVSFPQRIKLKLPGAAARKQKPEEEEETKTEEKVEAEPKKSQLLEETLETTPQKKSFFDFVENLKKKSPKATIVIDEEGAEAVETESEPLKKTGAISKKAGAAGVDNPNYTEVDLHAAAPSSPFLSSKFYISVPKIPPGMTEVEFWMDDEDKFLNDSQSSIASSNDNENIFKNDDKNAKKILASLSK